MTTEKLFDNDLSDIPWIEGCFNPIEQSYYLSGGQLCYWHFSGDITSVYSPMLVNGKKLYLGSYPAFTKDVSLHVLYDAVRAYKKGEGEWPSMIPEERIAAIYNVIGKFPMIREKVVTLLMLETGKERALAEDEFDRTVKYINDTIKTYRELLTERIMTPRGVVLCVGPFNYPMNEIFEPMFAALILGNTVLYKHAKYGVLMMEPFLEIFRECLPPGVVNTLYGEGEDTLTPCIQSGQLHAMMFIGSTKVANLIMATNPNPYAFHVLVGGGAKNVVVVTEKTDIVSKMRDFVFSALSFNGQRCTAGKLFFVHESIAEEFTKLFASTVDQLQIGMPWDKKNNPTMPLITPLPEKNKVRYMMDIVQDALSKGALQVSKNIYQDETLMRPIVLSNVSPGMRIYHEEQFGPVVPIVTYKNIKEVYDYHVQSENGQQIAIYDPATVDNEEMKQYYINLFKNQVSKINFNTPCSRGNGTVAFTGKKNSAKGVLSLRDALIEFSQPVVTAGN